MPNLFLLMPEGGTLKESENPSKKKPFEIGRAHV